MLITSALASCHTQHTIYQKLYDEYKPETGIDGLPTHWYSAFSRDSIVRQPDSLRAYTPMIPYRLPADPYLDVYITAPNTLHHTHTSRGGFGYHGSYHHVAS